MKQTSIAWNSRAVARANSICAASELPAIALITSLLCLSWACPLGAQTFKTIHSFTGFDGAGPSGVILSGDTLYGMTEWGGTCSNGTVYAIKIDGSGFKNMHSFTQLTGSGAILTNSDGAALGVMNLDGSRGLPIPQLGLVLSGTMLYGTACTGGINGSGTVFRVSIDGSDFAVLHHFGGTNDGAHPLAGMVLSGDTLYGTTSRSSPFGAGEVFRINTDGTGFARLHTFNESYMGSSADDGSMPAASLIISGNTLYGTTDDSHVFKVNTDGTGFSVLHTLDFFGTEGNDPQATLLLSGNRLYGTASVGGVPLPLQAGTVFAVNTDGTDFGKLYDFTDNINGFGGANPRGGLNLFGNRLYGTTMGGGVAWGVIFQLNTDGSGYKALHVFSKDLPDLSGGAEPSQTMVLAGNTFYGTTRSGGTSNKGTVFSFSLPVTPLQPAISLDGGKTILTWPTNITASKLLSTTNLASPVWAPVSSLSVLNGQNTVTNPTSGAQQFFRLSQ